MSASRVCICIPTCNAEKTLAMTLSSLQQQHYKDFNVLLVDNFSTDQTRTVAQQFIDSDPRFSLVTSSKHVSPEENFTRCIELAHGEFTAIFHSDDEYHLGMLLQQVAVMDSEPSVGVIFTRATDIDAQSKVIQQRFCPAMVQKEYGGRLNFIQSLSLVLDYGNFFICPTAMFRTVLLKQHVRCWQGAQFKGSADLDVWLRVMQHSDSYIIDQALIRHRVSDVSFSYHYNYLRTEPADILLVLDHYVKAYKAQLTRRDWKNYRLQKFKDQTNQAISHLLLKQPNLARRQILDALSTEIIIQSWSTVRHSKILAFAGITLLLSWLPMGNKGRQLVSWIRFGR